tara:strand:- start:76 stop:882 length:807 start_codon:yes stop_codon:yes gene_type:complete
MKNENIEESQLQRLQDTITLELSQITNEIKGDKTVTHVKPVVGPELAIQLFMPNNLYKAKRFYKIRPSWCENTVSMARNPSYYQYCIDHIEIKNGLWAEFGVKFGKSAKIISKIKNDKYSHIDTPYFGFDSFEGLPEDTEWGRKGRLTTKGNVPNIPGCKFYKGWFKDTIPEFNKEYSDPLAFLHVDCDIYSSTVEVLEGMKDKIISGTVICFDDMLSYSQGRKIWAGQDHEFKAFIEFVEKYNVEYEWIASVPNASQVACKIKSIDI